MVLECIRLVLTFPGVAAPAHRGVLQALLQAFRPKAEEEGEGEQQDSDAEGERRASQRKFQWWWIGKPRGAGSGGLGCFVVTCGGLLCMACPVFGGVPCG